MASGRMSIYSNTSHGATAPVNQPSAQVSTTTLLNALHQAYVSGQPYPLEASTSLVVNTWVTAQHGGTVDSSLASKAWEHARRRAEDGCIVLTSLHESTPSLLAPFIELLPLSVPNTLNTALLALNPFLHASSPVNPQRALYSALSVTFNLSLSDNATGALVNASLGLSASGLDTKTGLLDIPAQAGARAFDVFYYLLSASSANEREFLGIKGASAYTLLRKSNTFNPPSYLPTADDAAGAEEWRNSLKAIGIKGASLRQTLAVLAGILKLGDTVGYMVDEEVLEDVCEDVAGLWSVDPDVLRSRFDTLEREVVIAGVYECLVDYILLKANEAIRKAIRTQSRDGGNSHIGASTAASSDAGAFSTEDEDVDTVSITVIDIPNVELGKAVALRTVFDDSTGINAEMRDDGVPVTAAGHSVLKEMETAVDTQAAELNLNKASPACRERDLAHEKREAVLEKLGHESEPDGFLQKILFPVGGEGVLVGKPDKTPRFDLLTVLSSSRVWFQLAVHPTDDKPSAIPLSSTSQLPWSAGSVSRQLRSWRLPEWANRRNRTLDFTADFDMEEFCARYARLGCSEGRDGIENWIIERGWSNGEVVIGHERIWVRENAWWEAEGMYDMKPETTAPTPDLTGPMMTGNGMGSGYNVMNSGLNGSGYFGNDPFGDQMNASRESLMRQSTFGGGPKSVLGGRSMAPTNAPTLRSASAGDYGLGNKGDDKWKNITYDGEIDAEFGERKVITTEKVTTGRRLWVAFVWAATFWIPSFMLRFVGRMKRPDVRMAWREKVVLVFLIFLINAFIVFWIVAFGHIICPNLDKAWDSTDVSYHQGTNDFWVSVRGNVYDISKFWKNNHADIAPDTTTANMQPLAGLNLDNYFPVPLTIGCPGLVSQQSVVLQDNNTVLEPQAIHKSGPYQQTNPNTKLHDIDWYPNTFLPFINQYWKGQLVWPSKQIVSEGQNEGHMWFTMGNEVFDLTNYFYTMHVMNDYPGYDFLGPEIQSLVSTNAGLDLTQLWQQKLNSTMQQNAYNCIKNVFYVGIVDFRDSARCQVNNYILLVFTILLCAVILIKFLAALQLGSKRRPAMQDKFVICQVPVYTEGEDALRKGLDSLTSLAYDNKRKLICVICDGMVVGGGNDRPTPKIVLDILGVDPKIDPPALPFKSVGAGGEQLNYGKVYSGLYEYEGNVVPYIVVVKVGKESEQNKSKPGNRGKRDSQILLMSFLNRVHHRSPMNPLELEMFHQINNIIGVDPELYEYLMMVDADTSVREDSLNRLVASCANDAKIAGICGETSLQNEERSWWTMIQVYEYYISHHLAKAFESLFGSVTCLPGCFCMYRLRTVDKGKPLIISDKVVEEYSDCMVDTLHKKNLLSLGEDRYLTTLMTKHFPQMSYKFIPDAYALTAAPETWSVLLSQRRRWINSTVHNLAELIWLRDLCGFCCFSMRFVVFIDLFGTIILPATCCYLAYLIYRAASHSGQFPIFSIVILAAVYGLQAIIFIIKRQWQHVGWMIIYIISYPVYSFILPIYSFWNQDNFSWGNTRIVIGEKGDKQVVALGGDEDPGFDPRSIPLQRWDDYALQNGLPGRRGLPAADEKYGAGGYSDDPNMMAMQQQGMMGGGGPGTGYEMDDIRSVYSSATGMGGRYDGKAASTVLTGFGGQHGQPQYMPPQSSPGVGDMKHMHRTSVHSALSHYTDPNIAQQQHLMQRHQSMASMGGLSQMGMGNMGNMGMDPHSGMGTPMGMPLNNRPSMQNFPTSYNSGASTPPHGHVSRMSGGSMTNLLSGGPRSGPTDAEMRGAIQACLREVDLDSVTKKQLRALAEQRLQTSIQGERRQRLDQVIDEELANM